MNPSGGSLDRLQMSQKIVSLKSKLSLIPLYFQSSKYSFAIVAASLLYHVGYCDCDLGCRQYIASVSGLVQDLCSQGRSELARCCNLGQVVSIYRVLGCISSGVGQTAWYSNGGITWAVWFSNEGISWAICWTVAIGSSVSRWPSAEGDSVSICSGVVVGIASEVAESIARPV